VSVFAVSFAADDRGVMVCAFRKDDQVLGGKGNDGAVMWEKDNQTEEGTAISTGERC